MKVARLYDTTRTGSFMDHKVQKIAHKRKEEEEEESCGL